MSAFAVIYDRSGGLLEPSLLGRVMERLSHRGPDGQGTFVSGPLAIGHWHFWTTPEEVGEHQPLRVDGLPFILVFDGRLDNREELFAALSISAEEGRTLSDAALTLRAYAAWGQPCVEHFVGEYALVLFDERQHSLFCARDHLGDRTLFYALQGNRVIVASEPWAVLGACNHEPELNDFAVTQYFARTLNSYGQTFFKGVAELLPAHVLIVSERNLRLNQYWSVDFEKKLRYKTDEEYSQHLLFLLAESIKCRLRATTPAGVLMSGGLDSTSIAALAARQIAPQRLTTISAVFDELPDIDERVYIESVKEHWQINSIQIPGDNLWPYKNWANWPHNPNGPLDFLYRLLIEKVYSETHTHGLRVLFTGDFGDHLFGLSAHWLADYLLDFNLFGAIRESAWHLRQKGFPPSLLLRYLRPFFRRAVDFFPGLEKALRQRIQPPSWLTPVASAHFLAHASHPRRLEERLGSMISTKIAGYASGETFYASRHDIEIRTPYRDRRLVEFFVTLPAYQLYYRDMSKFILRNAMRNLLPEMVRTKDKWVTSFVPLAVRGFERERPFLKAVFENEDAAWRRYVRGDWLDRQWQSYLTNPGAPGARPPVFWMCVAFETWHQNLFS